MKCYELVYWLDVCFMETSSRGRVPRTDNFFLSKIILACYVSHNYILNTIEIQYLLSTITFKEKTA